MSYNGCFTEDEIKFRVPSLVYGSSVFLYDDEDEDDDEYALKVNLYHVTKAKKTKQITKVIASINDNIALCNAAKHEFMKNEIDNAVKRYSNYESLPFVYCYLVDNKNCIEILISGFLKKHSCGINNSLKKEIESLSVKLRNNNYGEVVYLRVSRVREFIYEKLIDCHGFDYTEGLDKEEFRCVLSTCRLSLYIHDYRNHDIDSIIKNEEETVLRREHERESPSFAKLNRKQKFIRNWKVRHLRNLSDFFTVEARGAIREIDDLARCDYSDIAELRSKLTTIYCDYFCGCDPEEY